MGSATNIQVSGGVGFVPVVMALAMFVMLAVAAGTAFAQQPPPDQDGYVAVTDADLAQEQLPAAPLVMAAYAIAWLAVFGYLWFSGSG
jgi:hypothetical protein